MKLKIFYLWVLCICLSLFEVLALYEEDIGKFDWHIRSIGPLKQSFFDQAHHTSRRVIVASELSVLASVTLRSGELVWRRCLEEFRPIDTVLHRDSTLVTVSDNGRVVRRWDPDTGHLEWEVPTEGDHETQESYVHAFLNDTNTIVLLTSSKLKLYTIGGHALFGKDLHSEMEGAEFFGLYVLKGSIALLAYIPDTQRVSWINLHNFRVVSKGSIRSYGVFRKESCIAVGMEYIVCFEVETAHFYVAKMQKRSEFNLCRLEGLLVEPTDLTEESGIRASDHFSKTSSCFYFKLSATKQYILELDSIAASVKIVQAFSTDDSLLLFDEILENTVIVFSLTSDSSKIRVNCYDLTSRTFLDSLEITMVMDRFSGYPVKAVPYLFFKKGQTLGYRLIVSFQDGSFSSIQQTGRITWTRDEALSDIVSAKFLKLSSAQENTVSSSILLDSALSSNPAEGFGRMIYSQIIYLRNSMLQLKQILFSPSPLTPTEGSPGLQSAVVFVTRLGKVYCLDSSSGLFLWRLFIPHLTGYLSSLYEDRCIVQVLQSTPDPVLAILGHSKSPHICNGTVAVVVNPLTGVAVSDYPTCLPYNVSQSVQLADGGSEIVALALLDTDHIVHIFPDNYSPLQDTRIFMYTADAQRGEISGHHFASSGDGSFRHIPTWSFVLPRDREELVYFSVKNPQDSIYANARVLSDRSVLYKYLNPHLAVLVTESRNERKPCVSVYVVDGVSGRLVHQLHHTNARSTVPPILAENWLAYQVVNLKEKRQELVILEMYEGKVVNNATVWTSFSNVNILILSNSFILPGDLYSMAVTSTHRGITPKDIILGFSNGQLFSLPKSFVEPKIPKELSTSPSPEPLKPPSPKIPMSYQRVINYNRSIDRLRDIIVVPAELESTCSVLAYGLDIYHTQYSPSKSFDKLAQDFGYVLIIAVLSLFLLGSLLGSKISTYRGTNQNWS